MKKLLFWVLFALTVSSASHAQGKTADVFNFEVIGVELGMTLAEAEEATKRQYEGRTTNVQKITAESPVSNKKEVTEMLIFCEETVLRVSFILNVASEKMEPVVQSVIYTTPLSIEIYQSFIGYASEKYGVASIAKPTDRGLKTHDLYWCTQFKADAADACDLTGSNASVQLVVDDMVENKIILSMSTQKYEEALRAYKAQR